MGKSWEEIATTMEVRRLGRNPLLEEMMQVRERYNGDYVIPDLGSDAMPLTSTIIADAIDHNGLRAAQVMPDIISPALNTKGPARNRAANRRKALLYTWEKSRLNIHLRRAYRHYFGYATTNFVVMPDFNYDCVTVQVRDPLSAFPEPKAPEDLTPPSDCGFIYGKSPEWLLHNYPEKAVAAGVERSKGVGAPDLWDVAEWIDEDDVVIGVLGLRDAYGSRPARPFELARWPNRVGRCTVVTPQRVTLDRIASAVANATGIADFQARLMHLAVAAIEKSIVPDTYIVGDSNKPPRLVGGGWKDGRQGDINEVLDANQIGQLSNRPDPMAFQLIAQLEDTGRQNTGTANPFLGQGTGGARTGRGIDALMAAAVDPRIQEAQEVMQSALTDVNRIVGDAYVGYFANKKYTVFAGWVSDDELTEFTPSTDFGETVENKTHYAIPGTDMVGLNVVLGQLVGTEAMSLTTMRKHHPYIKDAEGEERRVLVEKLRQTMTMQLLMRAQDPQGGLTPIDVSNIIKFVEQGDDLAAAVDKADEAARKRQAAEAPPPEALPPGQAAPLELMPGLANPGEGAEGLPPTTETPQGLGALDSLLGALSSPVGPRA
jgi:hypothetical protein